MERHYTELQSVSRAIGVLKAFEHTDEWSISDLARYMNLHKSVVHRLVVTLTCEGLLAKDPDTGLYSLSMLISSLARRAERRNTLARVARLHLRELATACEETVSLGILNQKMGLCLDNIDSPHPMRLTIHVGESFFLHAGSVGKTLLAFQPQDFIEQVTSAVPLARYTENTINEPDVLRKELVRIRQAGVAYSDGEITPGARSVGAPVVNNDGSVIACVVISVPTFRCDDQRFIALGRMVSATAERISRALGFTGVYPPISPEE